MNKASYSLKLPISLKAAAQRLKRAAGKAQPGDMLWLSNRAENEQPMAGDERPAK